MVQVYDADVDSAPAVAVTVNRCTPGTMPPYDTGVVHGDGVPPSSAHVNADAFVAENESDADVDEVVAAGPERILTVGACAGAAAVTVQVATACADPVASATRTAKT